jgi:nitrate/TMAO reductase-like tetraheme cytochrome c subunit
MDLAPKKGWLVALVHLASNVTSYVGVFLVNSVVVLWLFVLPVYLREGASHPYLSLFFIVALPAMFFLGLALVPIGMYWRYRKETKRGVYPQEFKPISWTNREFRNLAVFVLAITGVNILVGGYYSQVTVTYMDSSNFCGETCHSMDPEYTAYVQSPHRNVDCVQCHIGSGRRAKLEAKLNGISQMVGTILNNHSRPIPTPVHNLRPAREICESCHWPENFTGYRFHVIDKFAEDEQNTWSKTVLVLAISGATATSGIHGFHTSPGVTIEFKTDQKRQFIPWVRYTDSAGVATEYSVRDWPAMDADTFELREMDCMDCHTRPSHQFQVPGRALDGALADGTIDRTLPWIKKKGREIIRTDFESWEEADQRIPEMLLEFYRDEHPAVYEPRRADIEGAAAGLIAVYKRNVFPDMGITWALYPDNIGHTDFTGCFRCHFGRHESEDGRKINDACTACHQILAREEPEASILRRFGVR